MGAIGNFLLVDMRHVRRVRGSDLKEEEMRAIDCPCGHHLEGADDAELFRLAREHVDRDHPEMQRSDEQLRQRIAADAYDV
jgi:predicted small metal-binding protein